MDNEIQIKPSETNNIQLQTDAPPMVQVAQLLASGVDIDVDKMAKIQDMAERYEDNMARKAFFKAMSTAQAEIEGVYRNKKNTQTNSMYATLDSVIDAAKPIYTKHGFSVIFSEGKADAEGCIRVCADVLHCDGHERPYHYDLELDDKGIKGSVNKTIIHGKASSVSYARRYLMCMIWNIPTPDNDGNLSSKKEEIDISGLSDAQNNFAVEVSRLLEEQHKCKFNLDRVKKYMVYSANLSGGEIKEKASEVAPFVKLISSKPNILEKMKAGV